MKLQDNLHMRKWKLEDLGQLLMNINVNEVLENKINTLQQLKSSQQQCTFMTINCYLKMIYRY